MKTQEQERLEVLTAQNHRMGQELIGLRRHLDRLDQEVKALRGKIEIVRAVCGRI